MTIRLEQKSFYNKDSHARMLLAQNDKKLRLKVKIILYSFIKVLKI